MFHWVETRYGKMIARQVDAKIVLVFALKEWMNEQFLFPENADTVSHFCYVGYVSDPAEILAWGEPVEFSYEVRLSRDLIDNPIDNRIIGSEFEMTVNIDGRIQRRQWTTYLDKPIPQNF